MIAALIGPLRLGPRHARIVGQQHADLLDEALRQIVGQLRIIGENDIAARLQQADIARGGDDAGLLVIGDAVGQQQPVALRQFHIARSR